MFDIYIWSEGCNDFGKIIGICGIVYIYVNGVDKLFYIWGYNVVVLDVRIGMIFLMIKFF